MRLIATLIVLWLLAGMAQALPPARRVPSCDRACLEETVGRYVMALAARDSSKAPLSSHVRFTENGQVLSIGDGLWATAQKAGEYRVVIADVQEGTAGLFQVMTEAGQSVLLTARLTIVDGQITELETLVSRAEPGGVSTPEALTRQPAFFETVPEGERVSTTQLRNIANSYFDGLLQTSDKSTPFSEHCFRIENGSRTANNQPTPKEMGPLDCRGQYATGFSRYITEVRERRYPVVDEERGLVFTQVFFDHSGAAPQSAADAELSNVRAPFNRPYSFEIFELLKVYDGRITQIEAVLVPVPYKMPSNWTAPTAKSGARKPPRT
jgi:hypothetical protein